MTSRLRFRNDQLGVGRLLQINDGVVVVDQHDPAFDRHSCLDRIGPRPWTESNPLQIHHWELKNATPFNGSTGTTFFKKVEGHVPDYLRNGTFDHLPLPDLPSAGDDALKVLARTNPNRDSGADIVQDLMEGLPLLPLRLKKAGDDLIQRGANAHLWWEFGMGPLIDDLIALTEWSDLLEQRLREFTSLFEQGGLRRRVNLGTYSATFQGGSTAFQSFFYSAIGNLHVTTTARRWGTVRWEPKFPKPDFKSPDFRSKVLAILYGGDLSPASIWQKMPWSWLISWFTQVGLWMKANKNNFVVLPGPVCIMTEYRTERRIKITSKSSWVKGGGGTKVTVWKHRDVVPSGSLPLSFFRPKSDWGLGKSSILGSLTISKIK